MLIISFTLYRIITTICPESQGLIEEIAILWNISPEGKPPTESQ